MLKRSPQLSPLFDVYWRFAAARQELYFARLEGKPQPWTDDPILAEHRFTNAYRAADRVSQFLIRDVIYDPRFQSPDDLVYRLLLFKFFNRIEGGMEADDPSRQSGLYPGAVQGSPPRVLPMRWAAC